MKKIITKTILIFSILFANYVNAQFSFTNYDTTNTGNGLPDNFVTCVAADTNNNIWFGTNKGVAKYNGTAWTVYNLINTGSALADDYITCIAVDKNNNVWIGTDGYGVSKYNGSIWTTYKETDGLANNSVWYISGDLSGNIWFGTYGYGLSKLNGSTWTTYTYLDGLPGNSSVNTTSINYITVDTSGNKWFGTDMGVVKYDGNTFTIINKTNTDSLVDDNIKAAAIDKSGNKWMGTEYGISVFNSSGQWIKNYRASDGLYNNFVHDICIDSRGSVWMGMFAGYNQEGGITRYNGTNFLSCDMNNGLVYKQVIRLAVDKNDNIWVATDGGVSKIRDISGIEKFDMENIFNVYPNPAKNVLYIDLTALSDSKIKCAEVFNITGQKIDEYQISQTTKTLMIPLNKYPNGLYNIKIGNTAKKIVVDKN
ncbi:MAG: T9SS type A sorting domain-containing protein [Bacteroidia bacterium]|nr:T9SS type A sorting domain-containing protein [Bacteroidia bacterium]